MNPYNRKILSINKEVKLTLVLFSHGPNKAFLVPDLIYLG